MKAFRVIVQMVLGIAVPLMVQLWDRRRLRPEQREAAWNAASWGAALYAFGPLSMLGWCWVTRRGWVGIALGIAATALAVGVLVGVDALFDWALEGAGQGR